MAFSSSEGKLFFRDWLIHVAKPLGLTSFLDVGCGAGLYGDIIREVFGKNVQIDAVEPFVEYITRHDLKAKYDRIYMEDIRDACYRLENYDLIVCGDVLEHLGYGEALAAVLELKGHCRFLWGALPIKVEGRAWSTGYKQCSDEWKENPYNQHLHDWTLAELEYGFSPLWIVPFIQTGCFLVEGAL